MAEALVVLGGYLLGSLPSGYWLVRLLRAEDVRTQGSGNVGASNVWRVYGKRLGIPVALLDVGKGFAAALLGLWVGGEWLGVVAGAAAMVGHWRPLFLRFERGGKMVATAGGVVFALAPLAAFGCLAAWLLVFAATRYASLASLVTAAALPVLCILTGEPWVTVAFATLAAVAVFLLHRANIRRLLNGTESRFHGRGTARA